MVHTTSEFDVGKLNAPLHLPLKPDAVLKKTTSELSTNSQVNRFSDILEQYEIVSPVNKEEKPKQNTL